MASHFKWYPSETEVVVPFNARYSFPSQANKAVKMTPRIPPKNGSIYKGGGMIRVEFPAQGYVNPANTTLEFDVDLADWQTPAGAITRFQNNIQSLFSRVRLLYGATPIEDIINYNVVVRALTEWTGTNQTGTLDQTCITDGIGGIVQACEGQKVIVGPSWLPKPGLVNVRQAYIQGIDNSEQLATGISLPVANNAATLNTGDLLTITKQGTGYGKIPNTQQAGHTTRRYQVSFALGMFTQEKLIPTKFMASQLAIEITLEQDAACLFTMTDVLGQQTGGTPPTYTIHDVNLIPEILEFDASYDAMFLKGLQEGGVPIKFSSWHTYVFGTGGSSNLNLQIQERSRSVKAIFAVQRRAPFEMRTDSGALLFCSNKSGQDTVANTLQQYQFRIGGRYFPASPVQCAVSAGSSTTNGGAEAFIELQKALNIIGDYRLSTSVNPLRWATMPSGNATFVGGSFSSVYNEGDYSVEVIGYDTDGRPEYSSITTAQTGTGGNAFASNIGSNCFAMAIDLETSNGVEISGLNAEEQSDISLIATYSKPQNDTFNIEVYTYYDAMVILRENNVLELIQ